MGRMHRRARCGGVTLVELLVVVALIAIVHGFAVPAISGTLDSFRMTGATNTFFSSVMLARSEAVKRRARVVLCKSSSGASCTSAGGWEQGWIVFHDANNNAALDAGEALVWREVALLGRIRLTGNLHVADYLSYTAEGATRLTSGALQAGTFTVCRPSATPVQGRQIVIAVTGRPRLAKVTLTQCA